MKNLIVFYDVNILQTQLEDVAIPQPAPHEVLIKVEVAGLNTKDYKHPLPAMYNNKVNQGDDCAGTIAALGSSVRIFHVGERVAGFHKMDTLHGTFAEYAICPETTVFRIPETMTFEEAATIPLAAFTAAVGLYRNLELPAPWDRHGKHAMTAAGGQVGLIINGASTAVGAFAVKLAKMNPRIGPIITTAGASAAFVQALKPDAVIDYRSTTIKEDLKQALNGVKIRHVLDTSNSLRSIKYLTSVMEPHARYTCTSKLYANIEMGVDNSMEKALQAMDACYEQSFVGDVHEQPFRMGQTFYPVNKGGVLFGALMSRVFEEALRDGTVQGHPYRTVSNGLNGVLQALQEVKDRTQGGNAKFVARISDTTNLSLKPQTA